MTPTPGGSSTCACASGVEDTAGPGRFAWAEGQGGGGTTGLSGSLDGTIASLLVCLERKRAEKTGMAGCRGEVIVASGARGPRASTSKRIVRGRFPGPHRALPQGVGAAPVYLAGALGLNARPQAPAGVLNLEAHPRLTADPSSSSGVSPKLSSSPPDFRRGTAALPRSFGTKLCKGFVRTIMWFPHTSEPWLAGSRAPRAAVGRRVCPVRAIPASRMLIARHLPEHALIGGRREASLRWRFLVGLAPLFS